MTMQMSTLASSTVRVTPFGQNCTLLWDVDTRAAAIVDPGGDVDRIVAAIAKEQLAVEAIWLTHGHFDHAGGAEQLRHALGLGARLFGPHRADQFLLDSIGEQAAKFGIEGMSNAVPDRWLEEGDVIWLGEHRFDVLHCPGHTPGHVIFFDPVSRFAQVGDVLFAGSVGRTDFPYGDHALLIDAIQRKLMPLGDDVRFICGHGNGSTFGQERLNNPFLRPAAK